MNVCRKLDFIQPGMNCVCLASMKMIQTMSLPICRFLCSCRVRRRKLLRNSFGHSLGGEYSFTFLVVGEGYSLTLPVGEGYSLTFPVGEGYSLTPCGGGDSHSLWRKGTHSFPVEEGYSLTFPVGEGYSFTPCGGGVLTHTPCGGRVLTHSLWRRGTHSHSL